MGKKRVENHLLNEGRPLTAESIQEMLLLTERLRSVNNGVLDDESIQAVSEATGVPEEVVRATVIRLPEKQRATIFGQLRNSVLALDPDVRRYVGAAVLATNIGILNVFSRVNGDQYGIIGVFALVLFTLAMWNVAVAKDRRAAMFTGAMTGSVFFLSRSLFSMILQTPDHIQSAFIILYALFGMIAGIAFQQIFERVMLKLGFKSRPEERQQLLRQLVELQDKLRSGEQSMSFLSLDIVGSTRMKEVADPLAVEFTFTEYHNWVDWVTRKFGGQVHSTAGDGIICAFADPVQAYSAAKFLQTGIVELNTFRNKIGVPIQLRAGLHYGTVNAPEVGDVTKINFAHVIDIAAHLQKVAPIGGIAVSEAAATTLPGGPRVIGEEVLEVSNVKAYIWNPRPVSIAPSTAPPPLPS